MITISDELQMLDLGGQWGKRYAGSKICIYLQGELGAGKTTFVRGFLSALGYKGRVKSPTYTLVESYEIQDSVVYHFDLYRLKSEIELVHLGLQDYFTQSAICLIEWPDHFMKVLPVPDVHIRITVLEDHRLVEIVKK